MIKRTLYFGNPAYLSLNNAQLLVRLPEVEKNDMLPTEFKKNAVAVIPVEDIGIVVLDHKQVIITQALMEALLDNNVALITCNSTHHPTGLMLPLCVNTLQNERFRIQIDATEPLKKQLWQQTITQKIKNQAALLAHRGIENNYLIPLYKNVKSGDSDNCEALAAAYYWQHIFPNIPDFRRHREEASPNNYLNYGYAILRATMARSIVGAGLLPTLGIHHANKYNAYCLADDLMEPYRPFVDKIVCEILEEYGINEEMNKDIKAIFLKIPALDIVMDNEQSPLMVATQRTAVSLVKCFAGEQRKLLLPEKDL
jgi:CRISPR-associated protein Cas1